MPELPEVETTRRGLLWAMEGQKITSADIRRAGLRWPFPDQMSARLTGAKILRLGRRSKYILLDLSTKETVIIHLGMSGRMQVSTPKHPDLEKHDHVILHMSNGARIVFNDARRFGMVDLCATDQLAQHRMIAGLGPEPLGNDFSETVLISALKGRGMPIKAALLDQKIVAGLGNIYVCEVLFRTGLNPTLVAGKIAEKRVAALVPVIRQVLTEAIESGGSSLQDFRQTDGELGYFQHAFQVYGREGESCVSTTCTAKISRIVQSGRSTFYCPKCQR